MPTATNPFPYFPEAGTGGYIYIGAANQDAEANPITVYRDEARTIPWAQPIRTVNGYPSYQGAKAGIYVGAASWSITVKNSNSQTVTTSLDNDFFGMVRVSLSATTNYYVRMDGSDSNNGLANTAQGAFRTITKALNTVYEAIDLNGQVVIINVADGTYTDPISLYGLPVGASDDQPLRIIGNEVSPQNVVISTTGSSAMTMQYGAYALMAGMTFQTSGTGVGWNVQSNSFLEHRNCRFGNCANEMILTQHHASVRALGTTTVAGNAQYFCHATKRSIIDFAARTIAFSGTPTFSTYLWGINDASVNLDSGTITGSAVGPILVHKNGSLNTSSLTGSYLGGTAPVVNDGGYIFAQSLFENRTIYVRPGGNDNNDGLENTDARAFRTIGAAVAFLAKLPFNAMFFVTNQDSAFVIQVADGTYAETVNLRDVQTLGATIRGNEANPANVVVNGVTDGFVAIGLSSNWFLRGLTISATAGSCIRAERGSRVLYQNCRFATATVAHISAQTGSSVVAEGNYAITGAAAWHKIARTGSLIMTSDRTVTITGTPAFSQTYAFADDTSIIRATGMTFTGTATGKRYDVATNGVVNTNGGGASYFPGSIAGTTATGGQYV